jgi:hypothetical protein
MSGQKTTAALLLHTRGSSLTLRVRPVFCGDTYQDGRLRNDSLSTIIEFSIVGPRGDRFLAAYDIASLEPLLKDGFHPDPRSSIGLDGPEVAQLHDWLERLCNGDTGSDDLVALLVGDEDELARARVALAPLQLRFRTCGPGAALRALREEEPALVVLDAAQPLALHVLDRVRQADETLPVIAIGGDRTDEADAWLPQPVDGKQLVSVAAELLEFV